MREEVISSHSGGGTNTNAAAEPPVNPRRSSSPPPTPAASSAGTSSAVPMNVCSVDWLGSVQGSKVGSLSCIGSQPPRASLSTNACTSTNGSSRSSCRPWERGDLLRRLATYKPFNWSGKPKEANSLVCARRGWMNVDADKVQCESCGANLTFSASPTWTPAEVDAAGEAFAQHLDSGHEVTCPWRGNCCADSLVQFPPTPPSALIGGYKDRCDGLLQFDTLPIVASAAIDKMRLSMSVQIDRLLSQLHSNSSGELGFRVDETTGLDCSQDDSLCIYFNAQKLISLCGWEPRWLPNVQDYEEHSTQSARNACSFGPTENEFHRSRCLGLNKNDFSASAIKGSGKKKKSVQESKCNMRSPLLDCSLCGATVRIWDFLTIPRPASYCPSNIDAPHTSKKLVLTRGVSAASGINGWVSADAAAKEQTEGRDEAATNDEGKSLSNAGVDLNLTMAGGLPSTQSAMPVMSEHFDNGGMGRDLIIGQPSGSEVGDRAASYESRGPSTRKRILEEGGSTVDRPLDRVQQADSIEGTVIDRDADEVDDGIQCSDAPSKRARGLDIFDTYRSSFKADSSGAGPSRNLTFDIDIDVNRIDSFKEASDVALGVPSTKDSARASSVIAMDTICHSAEEDSMESVENYPGDADDVHVPSSSTGKNIDMNDPPEFNYSNQAQQSTCQPAAGSVAREMGGSSTNEGEEILNAETVSAHAKDRFSFGVSGGSVGMGASHEAEIHGLDVSVQRGDSVVGDAEPVAEVTENLGQTGESAPGPGVMDEFVPEEMDKEDPHGDSQDMMSRSLGRADSGSKIYGSTKAESVESGEKISRMLGHESSAHPSLSCNAVICSGYEASKEEVTQMGKASNTDDCRPLESDYICANGLEPANGENTCEGQTREFDPIKLHNMFCPWVNGNVAAAGCNGSASGSSSSTTVLCGWQLTLDALDTFQSSGHIPNQTMQSESAASLYKDEHFTPSQKLLARQSVPKSQGQL